MNILFLSGAGLAFLICLIHVFLGGAQIARPLLAAPNLNAVAKYTSYYCWHVVTAELALIGVFFAIAGLKPEMMALAWAAGALSASFVLLGVIGNPLMKLKFSNHPQWSFFVPLVALSVAGSV